MAKTNINPPAQLTPRPGDIQVAVSDVLKMSLFEGLRGADKLQEFPGAMVVRKYVPGQAIVVVGQPGFTAFYILTTEDLVELFESQETDSRKLADMKDRLSRLENLEKNSDEFKAMTSVATVTLDRPTSSDQRRSWFSFWRAKKRDNQRPDRPLFPDAPVQLTSQKPTDVMYEGEVFGEMSCTYRTPRSATVIANREWYVLEMLRNVYDKINAGAFKKRMDEIYLDRVLKLHIRNNALFATLDDREFAELEPKIRSNVDLITKKADEIIVDQHERSDTMYIIRSGFAQVQVNVSPLLSAAEFRDRILFKQLCEALAKEHQPAASDPETEMPAADREANKATPVAKRETAASLKEFVRQSLRTEVLSVIRRICEGNEPTNSDVADVVFAVNDLISAKKGPWPTLCASLVKESAEASSTVAPILSRLAEGERQSLEKAAKGSDIDADHVLKIVDSVNREFEGENAAALQGCLGIQARLKVDVDRFTQLQPSHQTRYLNRMVLDSTYPAAMPRLRFSGPIQTVVYRSQGEFIGEIGVVRSIPRTASCIAYDHPAGKFGNVELVEINKSLLEDVKLKLHERPDDGEAAVAAVEKDLNEIIEDRLEQSASKRRLMDDADSTIAARTFDDLGLVQGNRLMVIDLDRCTRCNECVQACVDTHKDRTGELPASTSRLYLDGSKAGRFLVPATCRQCTDPVCLIGCPVGSIHKGLLGQIEIEDWCIGCTRCAEQCPYDSIQMHHVGLLSRGNGFWRSWHTASQPEKRKGKEWYDSSYDDGAWYQGMTPFFHDFEFRNSIHAASVPAESSDMRFFRVSFSCPANAEDEYMLQVESQSLDVRAWLNGKPVELETLKKRKRDRGVEWDFEATVRRSGTETEANTDAAVLVPGKNVLAVALVPPKDSTDTMLDVGLYAISDSPQETIDFLEGNTDWTEKFIMQKAVVCDMCASLPSQTPSCVAACPHEAAWRGGALSRDAPYCSSR
ncbi:MAG: 4Fe-4S binding protein [Planctomycetales bacterium]|nr:4Fe-4S binding protein [Planctomycetales bacterium]